MLRHVYIGTKKNHHRTVRMKPSFYVMILSLTQVTTSCARGCGTMGDTKQEFRIHYSSPLSTDVCIAQEQIRTIYCSNSTGIVSSDWCPHQQGKCTNEGLFLYPTCTVLPTKEIVTNDHSITSDVDPLWYILPLSAGILILLLVLLIIIWRWLHVWRVIFTVPR